MMEHSAQVGASERLRQGIARGAMALAICVSAVPCSGQDMPVPVETQVSIISRVLAFDRRFASTDDDLVVAIVYQTRFRESLTAATAASRLFDQASAHGRTMRAIMVPIDEFADFARIVATTPFALMYVTPLRAVAIEQITQLTRRFGVLTCTGVPGYVAGGIGIGVSNYGGRPTILINLHATTAERSHFSSELLKLARIVDDPSGHGGG